MSQLFAQVKETEEVVIRRVSRRVERYLEKLKLSATSAIEAHPIPEPPREFEDDAPTLILRQRGSGVRSNAPDLKSNQKLPEIPIESVAPPVAQRSSPFSSLQTKSEAEANTLPSLSAVGVRSSFGDMPRNKVPMSIVASNLEQSTPQSVRMRDLPSNVGSSQVQYDFTEKSVFSETSDQETSSETDEGFDMSAHSQFDTFDTNAGHSLIKDSSHSSIDLKRFAEVSKLTLGETGKRDFGNSGNPADSEFGLDGVSPPSLFVSSRSSIVVFSLLGLAVLAVLYFLLAFDKYVY